MRREEIIVNSNNHIYGTQGAGKTTIEKAVNFFYTARKPQSSNDPGKKSFEDFYFPHSYSYIIYEVDRSGDNGKFCVIVYKDGRVMFRFVDAPYDQYWLVDPETKEPRHRPELVQKALAEKGILNFPVKTYENYRNVLYGRYSNDVPRKDFERFLIDRNDDPAGYANVLNSMFASDRINTETLLRMVINSEKGGSGREGHDTTMARIDIARIRDLLKDYRMVNSNIEKWTDENGSVYRNTSNAIEALKQLSGCEGEQIILLGEIRYAIERAARENPILNVKMDEIMDRIKKNKAANDALEKECKGRKESLDQEIGGYKKLIDKCDKIKKDYPDVEVKRCKQSSFLLPSAEAELKEKEKQYAIIKDKNRTVTDKYSALKDSKRHEHAGIIENLNSELHRLRTNHNKECESLNNEKDAGIESSQKESLDSQYKATEQILDICDKMIKNRDRLIVALDFDSYDENLDSFDSRKTEIETSVRALEEKILQSSRNQDKFQDRLQNEIDNIESKYNDEIQTLTEEAKNLTSRMNMLGEYLLNKDNSLYGWLECNKPDWRENIGLFLTNATAYAPFQSLGNEQTALEVSIKGLLEIPNSFHALECSVQTPEELEAEISRLGSELERIKEMMSDTHTAKESAIGDIRKKFMQDFQKLKDESETLNQSLLAEKKRLDSVITERDKFRSAHRKSLLSERQEIDREYESLQEKRESVLSKLREIGETAGNIFRRLINIFNAKKEALEKEFKEQESSILDKISEKEKVFKADMKSLSDAESLELAGIREDGIDPVSLANEIERLTVRVSDMKKDSNYYNLYLSLEREYLSERSKNEILLTEAMSKTQSLEDYRNEKSLSLEKEKIKLNKEKDECKDRQDFINKGLDSATAMMQDDAWAAKFSCVTVIENNYDCEDLIRSLGSTVTKFGTWSENLRTSVTNINDSLKGHDTFGFSGNLFTLDDYRTYAEKVRDFRESGDIDRTIRANSHSFLDALVSAKDDFTDVESNYKETYKSINSINRDLAGKGFCNVIRNIELTLDTADEGLVEILRYAKEFCEEHRDEINLGELSLWNADKAVNGQYTDIVNRLLKELEKPKYLFTNEIYLHDLYTLKVRADENNNKGDWRQTLHEIGSNGTGIIVRALIYISFINTIRKKRDNVTPMHFIIDETGTLADQNLEGLVQYANDKNFIVLSASPQCLMNSLDYKYVHLIEKDEEEGMTKIILEMKPKDE